MEVHRHNLIRGAVIIVGTLAILGVGYVYSANLASYGQSVLSAIEGKRQQNLANLTRNGTVVAAVTTDVAKTEGGRLVYVETTQKIIDPIAELNALKQAAIAKEQSFKEELAKVQEAGKQQLASLTATFNSTVSDIRAELSKKSEQVNAPPAPTAEPAVAPQAQLQPAPEERREVGRNNGRNNGRIVSPDNANSNDIALMAKVYRGLGATPNGSQLGGFQTLGRGDTFICPNGRPGRKVTAARLDDGGTGTRWACN